MTKLNILYIHGFGSKVDPSGDKQIALRKIANVAAFAPDYTRGYQQVMADLKAYLSGVDLLIGTSMGGFLVSHLAKATDLPFIAINPVIQTKATLSKFLGAHIDYYGRAFTLTPETIDSYPDFLISERALVLLDMGDELLDSMTTLDAIGHKMRVHTFAGGTHRFAHMKEALPIIKDFARQSRLK